MVGHGLEHGLIMALAFLPYQGFIAILAVLITGASQSRQHDTLLRLPMDIRLKNDLGKSVGDLTSHLPQSLFDVSSGRISIVIIREVVVDEVVNRNYLTTLIFNQRYSVENENMGLFKKLEEDGEGCALHHWIDDSLRIVVCSVWGHVGYVGPERLRLGDIKLLLVAFESQLKVFHSLKNDNTSGKHPQCNIQAIMMSFIRLRASVNLREAAYLRYHVVIVLGVHLPDL
ncbi:hypothetical protein Tco_0110056 [Tanacetum coccineum]